MRAVDHLTFALAYTGYLGLCAGVTAQAAGRLPRALTAATAAVVLAHVLLVWAVRYEWSPAVALAPTPARFVVFHTALGLLLAAAAAPARWSGRLVLLAFPVVTAGAAGAVLRRAEVAGYRWPVLGAAAVTVVVAGVLLGRGVRRRSRGVVVPAAR